MPKNHFVSTNASSSPTKVTWECSSNTQDDTEKRNKVLNTQLPDKQTYRAKNHFVSIIAPSSPTKVTWESSGNSQHAPENQQVGQEKTTFQKRNMEKNSKHINMCKQRQTEYNQTSSKTLKVDNPHNKDDKKCLNRKYTTIIIRLQWQQAR